MSTGYTPISICVHVEKPVHSVKNSVSTGIVHESTGYYPIELCIFRRIYCKMRGIVIYYVYVCFLLCVEIFGRKVFLFRSGNKMKKIVLTNSIFVIIMMWH